MTLGRFLGFFWGDPGKVFLGGFWGGLGVTLTEVLGFFLGVTWGGFGRFELPEVFWRGFGVTLVGFLGVLG